MREFRFNPTCNFNQLSGFTFLFIFIVAIPPKSDKREKSDEAAFRV